MADVINLRGARKAKARQDLSKTADANRVAFGTPRAERQRIEKEKAITERRIDGHIRECGQAGASDD